MEINHLVGGIGIVCGSGYECLHDFDGWNDVDFEDDSKRNMEQRGVVADVRIVCGGEQRDELYCYQLGWDHVDNPNCGGKQCLAERGMVCFAGIVCGSRKQWDKPCDDFCKWDNMDE